jgi:phospholipid/cholesterol/gamma-HCH transport system permease protein
MNLLTSRIGTSAQTWLKYIGQLTLLWSETVTLAVTPPYKGWRSLIQAQRIGPGSFIISAMVAFFVGMIIALQMAYQMVQMSAELYIPNVVAVALTRELTPVLTSLIVAGRIGAGIAASIPSNIWSCRVSWGCSSCFRC